MNEIECPDCGEWIELPDFAVQVNCPQCQNDWVVDVDGDFTDGLWRDRTRLIAVV